MKPCNGCGDPIPNDFDLCGPCAEEEEAEYREEEIEELRSSASDFSRYMN